MINDNPYPWRKPVSRLLYKIRQPSNRAHRMFWAFERIPGPIFWIYYCGVFSIVWGEDEGWHWGGWNFD